MAAATLMQNVTKANVSVIKDMSDRELKEPVNRVSHHQIKVRKFHSYVLFYFCAIHCACRTKLQRSTYTS